MNSLQGTGVALVTPFNEDKTVDFISLEKVINHVIDGGVDYLVVMGTTAENATLSFEEKQSILSFIVGVNNSRLPIVFGLGGNNTLSVVEDIKKYDLSGVSAILSVCPYYNKPNQNGIYAHYSMIAKNCPLPIILYNVPGRTGVNMSVSTTLKLANEFSNIVATKEACGDIGQISYLLKDKPKDFIVISGDDNLTLPIISIGGLGVISVSANALPKAVSTYVKAALDGDYTSSRGILNSLLEFQDLIFEEGNPVGIKSAMQIKGLLSNNLRLPLVPSSAALDASIERCLKENNL